MVVYECQDLLLPIVPLPTQDSGRRSIALNRKLVVLPSLEYRICAILGGGFHHAYEVARVQLRHDNQHGEHEANKTLCGPFGQPLSHARLRLGLPDLRLVTGARETARVGFRAAEAFHEPLETFHDATDTHKAHHSEQPSDTCTDTCRSACAGILGALDGIRAVVIAEVFNADLRITHARLGHKGQVQDERCRREQVSEEPEPQKVVVLRQAREDDLDRENAKGESRGNVEIPVVLAFEEN
mmetsp:Transcript_115585/g.331832  ORF Transcript_115585/g.331832 Transcript_115585/m.331832 type:complete len:241 (-) Transcript_115585:433-1155(-)